MLSMEGIHNVRTISWSQLKPGMVVLQGFTVNGLPLPELQDFPVLTTFLIDDLFSRYRLRHNRRLLVGDALPGFRAYDISAGITRTRRSLVSLNQLRGDYSTEKQKIFKDLDIPLPLTLPVTETDFVEKDFLIKDRNNSFSYLYGLDASPEEMPSFFSDLELHLSLGDVLTGRLQNKLSLPADEEIMLHLVIDYSRSMESAGKLDMAVSALNMLHRFVTETLQNTKLRIYTFSDSCRPVEFPLTGQEMRGGETNYSTFMKKVLHLRNRDLKNKIILFTDGLPSDRAETLKMAALLKKNRIDYTQIIFNITEEQREEVIIQGDYDKTLAVDSIIKEEDFSPQMTKQSLNNQALEKKMQQIFSGFTEIAETAGGNQIIIKVNRLLKLVTLECYDRYLGLLTLARKS